MPTPPPRLPPRARPFLDDDNEDTEDYEPPPMPQSVTPDTAYIADIYLFGTRRILREHQRTRVELRNHRCVEPVRGDPPIGPLGWLGATLSRLPHPIQTSLALLATWTVIQVLTAGYERVSGHPLPMMPAAVAQGASISTSR